MSMSWKQRLLARLREVKTSNLPASPAAPSPLYSLQFPGIADQPGRAKLCSTLGGDGIIAALFRGYEAQEFVKQTFTEQVRA